MEEGCNYKQGTRILFYSKYRELVLIKYFNWKKVATIDKGLDFFPMISTVN